MPPADQIGYYTGMRDAILGRAPLPVSPESAIAVMAVLETTLFASAKKDGVSLFLLRLGRRRAYQEQRETERLDV